MTLRVGLISDTHGLLRSEAIAALAGADVILHAGDIGKEAVLDGLREIAPLHAVRGNVDRTPPLSAMAGTRTLDLGGVRVLLLHRAQDVTAEAAAGADVVVCGHSHKPLIGAVHGTVMVNPGSAGPRRFRLPVSVGWLEIEGGSGVPRLVTLAC